GRVVRRTAAQSPDCAAHVRLYRSTPAAAATSTSDVAVALGRVPASQPRRISLLPLLRVYTNVGAANRMSCCDRSTTTVTRSERYFAHRTDGLRPGSSEELLIATT